MSDLRHIEETKLPNGCIMRAATFDDLQAVVDMSNACSQELFGRDEYSLETVEFDWKMPKFDLAKSTRVVEDENGKIVGNIEVYDYVDKPVRPFIWGNVHPDYRNRGIGSALMAWGLERAKEAIDRCPPEALVYAQASLYEQEEFRHKLFEKFRMEPIRNTFKMQIDMQEAPPKPTWPEGISVRVYEHPKDLEATVQAVVDGFRDHWGFVEPNMDEEIDQWLHFIEGDPDSDTSIWYLAIDDETEEIAAICLCRPKSWYNDPEVAFVDDLAVRPNYRKRGLGLALLHHAFGELWNRGYEHVALMVDASSLTGATRLYERAGMHVNRRRTIYRRVLRDGVDISTTEASS